MAGQRKRRRCSNGKGLPIATVDNTTKAMIQLEKLLFTMTTKTWSVISGSVHEEERYMNTVHKALLGTVFSFNEMQQLFVDCCILRKIGVL